MKKLEIILVLSLLIVVAGCGKPPEQSNLTDRLNASMESIDEVTDDSLKVNETEILNNETPTLEDKTIETTETTKQDLTAKLENSLKSFDTLTDDELNFNEDSVIDTTIPQLGDGGFT